MSLLAGAAHRDISPPHATPLFGYPHAERMSTGVHDPLLASALVLENDGTRLVMIALDLLFLEPPFAKTLREAVAGRLGTQQGNVFISCSHTHSGPVTSRLLAWQDDPTVPPPDTVCLEHILEQTLAASQAAAESAIAAEIAWTTADAAGVGSNRIAPNGVTDPECGVLMVRNRDSHDLVSLSLIYGMHPTVLHEDSTLVSSDFPHFSRLHLREQFGADLVVLYHTAPCGNQSPRHVVTEQTFAEAERLGRKLGHAVADSATAVDGSAWTDSPELAGGLTPVSLPRRQLRTLDEATNLLAEYRTTYDRLRLEDAPHPQVRTAECAVFGAESTVALARAQQSGELDRLLADCAPIEVQVLRIGSATVVGLPGECFTEYALEIKHSTAARTFVVSLVNGELQGYIVTPEAEAAGGYEATNAVFAPDSGPVLVQAALDLSRSLS